MINSRAAGILTAILLTAPAWTAREADAAGFAGPETCAACHSEEHVSWKASIHARAYASEKFQREWKRLGKKSSCLKCHTTGWKSGRKFEHSGVTCESCHGPMSEGHPGEAKMPLPVSSTMCQDCHRQTFQEWRLSTHSRKNIRCFDCHNVHAQGLRAGGGEKLCGACHPGRIKDFAHATHHLEGLTCQTCHMPATAAGDAIMGTGAAGHSLSVGVAVCARCHDESVHKSGNLPKLREEVSGFHKQLNLAGTESVFELKEKNSDLSWRLDRARQSLWLTATLGLLAGLALGWLGGWYAWRGRLNQGLRPKKR